MKMKVLLSALIVFALAACKKEQTNPAPAEQPLLTDGPLSPQLGKMINLGKYGFSRSQPVWGRNSDELFITAATDILRVDLSAKKVEAVEKSGGLVTGKTNENSGVIFQGKINNQPGYYVYNFSSNTPEKIITVPANKSSIINIGGNNIFYYETPAYIPPPPCDGFCWPAPGPFVPATFYHLDKQTHQITSLDNKQFMLFSPDGSTSVLLSQSESRIYTFDNTSRTITDSADVFISFTVWGLLYYGNVLHSFETDPQGNIIIKNFSTGQLLRQYQTNKVALENFRVSADGTKLYYSGGILNANSLQILVYDIATNTEKKIIDLPFGPGGALPFGYFVLSDDNKKMAIESGNDLYVKVLD